ncbi:hypothetical protein FDECE_806 [Fusarium decemcellulare]|nr:hypothetical protein FDECE_806 [Fusarium decemcellulare]
MVQTLIGSEGTRDETQQKHTPTSTYGGQDGGIKSKPSDQEKISSDIRDQTKLCLDLFEECQQYALLSEGDWVDKMAAEFNWWSLGIGAAKSGHASLDYRVQPREDVKNTVMALLNSLAISLKNCIKLAQESFTGHHVVDVKGKQPETSTTNTLSRLSLEQETELDEQRYYIRTTVQFLIRISSAIRKSGTKFRHERADNRLRERQPELAEFRRYLLNLVLLDSTKNRLLNHLLGLQNMTKEPIWTKTRILIKAYLTDVQRLSPIRDRLIRANITRRNRFDVYIEEYHRRLQNNGHLPEPEKLRSVHESPPFQQDDQLESAASQAPEPNISQGMQPKLPREPTKLPATVPSTQSATKIGSFIMPRRPREQETPSVSTKVSQGAIKQDYPKCPAAGGESFWCPYCAQLLDSSHSNSNNRRWRGHLAEDLSPYVCIYTDCDSPDTMYVTTTEWKKHIKDSHSEARWICDPCWLDSDDPGQYEFLCQEDWCDHTVTEHRDEFEDDDLLDLAEASQRTVIPYVRCPLCYEDTALLHPETDKHLAEHLHSFALQALPWDTITVEDDTRVSVGSNIGKTLLLEDTEDFSDEFEEAQYHISDLSTHINATMRSCDRLARWKLLTNTFIPADLLIELNEALQRLLHRFTSYHSYLKHDIAICLMRFDRIFQALEESDVGIGFRDLNGLQFLGADVAEGLESLNLIISSGNQDLSGDIAVRVIPFARNEDFIPRPDFSKQLDILLAPSSEFRIAALSGIGGSGKTQIALDYAYRRSDDQDCSVFWANTANEEAFVRSFRLIAGVLGIDDNLDDDILLATVKSRIEAKKHWVLVLDSADDLALFDSNRYNSTPQGPGGTLLWTSRDRSIAGSLVKPHQALQVGQMTVDEATALFLATGNIQEPVGHDTIAALWQAMGGLPLAIAQAGAVVRQTSMSPERLMAVMNDKNWWDILEDARSDRQRRPEYSWGILETFKASIWHLRQENEKAQRMLSVVAYLAPDAIWYEMMAAAYKNISEDSTQEPTEEEVQQAIRSLLLASMISTFPVDGGSETRAYRIHRLVQSVVRASLTDETSGRSMSKSNMLQGEDETYFTSIALGVVSDLFPTPGPEMWARCERYAPHVKCVSKWAELSGKELEVAQLLERFSDYLGQRESWEEKATTENRILELRRKKQGEKHPDTIKSMWNLGSTYHAQGLLDKTEDIMGDVLSLQQEVLGRHPDTIWTMAYLAANYQHQQKYEEAEFIGKEALHLQREVLGDKHPDTISSMALLAATYQHLRQYDKAETVGLGAFERQEELLGHEHPDTINSMASLAATYQHMGLFEEAEAFGLRALDLHEDVLGEEHPDTMWSMASLSMIYNAQGQVDAAQEHGTRAFSVHQKVLGEKHPDTLHAMHNFALIWDKSNRLDDALGLMRECFELRRLVLGPDHLSTRASGERLAELRWKSWSSRPQIRHVVSQTDEGGREKGSKEELFRNRRRARSLVDGGTSA